jgi:hypothetical protein
MMRNKMTITNNADQMFFSSPSIVINSQLTSVSPREFVGGVNLVTEVPSCGFTSISAIAPFSIGHDQYLFTPQYTIISLANEMFKGSKPMMGEELELLRKTYKRLLKNSPTSFI